MHTALANPEFHAWLHRSALALGILAAFLVVALVIRLLSRRLIQRLASRENLHLLRLLVGALWVVLVLIGVISALGTLGINVSAMIASLGLTGFALGFALRDALSNLLAGIMILLYRPFHTGQRVRITSFEGVVTNVNLRYITIDSSEGEVLIPSSTVLTNPVVVLKAGAGASTGAPSGPTQG